ncbi:hypothetical protein GNX14_27145 [Mesorhizobium japonicum]|uniref:hypothetical protein n=1 Tax=Mesorhizobium TaxID=68287 RepID=UPI0012E273FA|nr:MULTISPECIES: hypothetical protein [Mesorhizobium]MUT24795.1 hypothetical protein [Mesorhizobium japonicum]
MSAAAKKVGSGEHPDVSCNTLPPKIENLRKLEDGQVGMRAKAQDPKAIKVCCYH